MGTLTVYMDPKSHTHDAVKSPRFAILMCCLSDANPMVPFWKRKRVRLTNVDGQHSGPLCTSTSRNAELSNQLESKQYAEYKELILLYLRNSDGFAWFCRSLSTDRDILTNP
jgi:hypothetical protein